MPGSVGRRGATAVAALPRSRHRPSPAGEPALTEPAVAEPALADPPLANRRLSALADRIAILSVTTGFREFRVLVVLLEADSVRARRTESKPSPQRGTWFDASHASMVPSPASRIPRR